jgi:hypothetical protein
MTMGRPFYHSRKPKSNRAWVAIGMPSFVPALNFQCVTASTPFASSPHTCAADHLDTPNLASGVDLHKKCHRAVVLGFACPFRAVGISLENHGLEG